MHTRPIASQTPRISFALADSTGRVVAQRDPDQVYYAASTVKLAVLLAALRRVGDGEVALEDTCEAARTFVGVDGGEFTLADDHVDSDFSPVGTALPLAETLDAMVSRSSNEATNMVMQLVSAGQIEVVLTDCGAARTRIQRMIGDPAALASGLTNETTAYDLVALMRCATTGNLGSAAAPLPEELTQFAIRALECQTIAPIGAALPRGVRWGSKSGEIDGIRHDVAFIGDPASAGVLYFAVCTEGIGVAAADEAIAALTDALVLTRL